MVGASEGLLEAKRNFERLGVSVYDTQGKFKDIDTMFLEIIDEFGNLESTAEKTRVAMMLFGGAGKSLIPFFELGREAIEELSKEAEALGIVMTAKDVAALKLMDDQLTTVRKGFLGLSNIVVIEILPQLIALSVGAKEVIKNVIAWVREHSELIGKLALFAGQIGIVLTVLGTLAITIGTLLGSWKLFSMAFGILAGPFKILLGLFTIATFKILLIGATIGGAIAVVYKFRQEIASFSKSLFSNVKTVGSFVIEWIEKILSWLFKSIEKIPILGKKFSGLFKSLKDDVGTIAGFIGEKTGEISNAVTGKTSAVFSGVKDKFDTLKEGMSSFSEDIKTKTDDLMAALSEKTGEAEETFKGPLDRFREGWAAATEETKSFMFEMGEAFRESYDSMLSGFSDAIADMIMEGKSFSESMQGIFKGIGKSIISTVTKLVTEIIAKEIFLAGKVIFLEAIKGKAGAISQEVRARGLIGLVTGPVAGAAAFGLIMALAGGFEHGGAIFKPTLALMGENYKPERITPMAGAEALTAGMGGFAPAGAGLTVNFNISGEFLEGDETRWSNLTREHIVPQIETYLERTGKTFA